MKQDLKFDIGDWVIVKKTMFRDKQGDKVTWRTRLPFVSTKPRVGRVVGLCTRYDGEISCEDWDFRYFVQKKSHRFWLVKFGLMNKAVEVSEEDMRLAKVKEIEDFPTLSPPPTIPVEAREFLSEDSKHWPRDEKGRWRFGPMHSYGEKD